MTAKTYYIKPGVYSSSAIPLIQSSTAYSVGVIRRATYEALGFLRCSTAGTTGTVTSMVRDGSDPLAAIVSGSSAWVPILGMDGEVANTWDIASASIDAIALVGIDTTSDFPRYGGLHSLTHEGATVVFDKTMVITAPLVGSVLFKQYVGASELLYGGSPIQYVVPDAPLTPVRLISAASGTYPYAYQKGLTLNYANNTWMVQGGYTEFWGTIINVDGGYLRFYIESISSDYDNARNHSVVTFIDCDINLSYSGLSKYPVPKLQFGGQELASGENSYTVRARGLQKSKATFIDCALSFNHNLARHVLQCDASYVNCTFSSTGGYLPTGGIFTLGTTLAPDILTGGSRLDTNSAYLANTGDIDIRISGCTFIKARSLVSPEMSGRVSMTFDGCAFHTANLRSLFDNIPATTQAEFTADLYGCGPVGSIDRTGHLYITPRLSAEKQKSVYRVGGAEDQEGDGFSYYIRTKGSLSPYYRAEELPQISAEVTPGTYRISLFLRVPPGSLLTDAEFFIHAVGPDSGDSQFTVDATYGNTRRVSNFATNCKPDAATPAVTLPQPSITWVSSPSGWITQKSSVILTVPNRGKVLLLPFAARSYTEFIMCPAPYIERIA